MGDIQAGQNFNVFLLAGTTIFVCVILHFVYKTVFKSKKKEALKHEIESDTGKFNACGINEIKILIIGSLK